MTSGKTSCGAPTSLAEVGALSRLRETTMDHIPTTTLRTFGLLLVVAFEAARDGVRTAAGRIQPYLRSPADLRVHSTLGHHYSGVVLIDDNEVLAGIVARTGRSAAQHRTTTHSPPTSRSPSARRLFGDHTSAAELPDFEEDDDGKLPSWASDPRDGGGHRW